MQETTKQASAITKKELPKTDQVIEYQSGDDGTYQKGYTGTRFTDNGDGTITDNATGLQWVKQPELIIPGASVRADNQIQVAHGAYANGHAYIIGDLVSDGGLFYVCVIAHTSNGATVILDLVANPLSWRETVWTGSATDLITPSLMTWGNSIINSEALIYAGFSDWRLPNITEIYTLIDNNTNTPSINLIFFPNTLSNKYWGSTTLKAFPTLSWYIFFDYGYRSQTTKTAALYLRPVRGN